MITDQKLMIVESWGWGCLVSTVLGTVVNLATTKIGICDMSSVSDPEPNPDSEVFWIWIRIPDPGPDPGA